MRRRVSRTPALPGIRRAAWLARCLAVLAFAAAAAIRAAEPDFDFHAPPSADDPTTPAVMRDLAERVLPVYQEMDRDKYLSNLSALQMVAGDYTAAYGSRQSLRDRRRIAGSVQPIGRGVIYDIYVKARAMAAENHVPFAKTFTQSFQDVIPPLNDLDAYAATGWLGTSLSPFREALQQSFAQQRTRDRVSQAEAVDLIWKYLAFDAYRAFGPLVGALDADDDRRRYVADDRVLIKTRAGAAIEAVIVRPRSPATPLPALFEFTIPGSPNYARECAAHGYVGVVAYSRGQHAASGGAAPYQHDGDDARVVIEWIARQAWSDGRVAMYGDGFGGFAAWAAAKRAPKALKAIATSAPTAPGIDFPMDGGIFQNSAYRWSLTTTSAKASVRKSGEDGAPWRSLNEQWYRSGRRYRDLGRLHGEPDPIFIRWLNHPSYDRFWQSMVPYGKQFAKINFPVLTTAGYFAASEPGALYYFTEHLHYNPHADHTLVIGPYDDASQRHGAAATLHGLQIDSSAAIDLHALRYQWFDHVLKAGAAPPLLLDRVNFEVMGANQWRHAPTLEAMATERLKLYLDPALMAGTHLPDEAHTLARRPAPHPKFIRQTVSLSDRRDADWTPPTELISRTVPTRNGVLFVSAPLPQPFEFDGLFSGRLDFTVNKMDLDLNITLYELLATGEYVRLFDPTDAFRVSYVRDRVHRHLIGAGERQAMTFRSERMTSRQLQQGSRIVMVLAIAKRPDREINYGAGNDVSEESIADGGVPVKVRWYGDSYIDIPARADRP